MTSTSKDSKKSDIRWFTQTCVYFNIFYFVFSYTLMASILKVMEFVSTNHMIYLYMLCISLYFTPILTSFCIGYARKSNLSKYACYISTIFFCVPSLFILKVLEDLVNTVDSEYIACLYAPFLFLSFTRHQVSYQLAFCLTVTLPLVAWLSAVYGEYRCKKRELKKRGE